MFDGAAMASVTADRPLPSDDPLLPLYRQALQETPPLRLALPVAAPLTERIADKHDPAMDASVPATAPKEHALIVLASSLAALQVRLQAQHPDAIVRLLPADAEPLQAIANLLSQEKGLTEVHLISHGEPGALVFGDLRVDQAYLSAHASTLTAWKDALAPGADLLLYGCDIGAQGAGSVFLQQLQTTLGVDLAASSDTTGSSAKGADAQLEVVLGQVDSRSVLSAELLDKLGLMLDSVAPTVTSASVALNDRSLQITLTLSESVSASTGLASTRLNIVVGNETLLATLDSNASDAASGKLVYTTNSTSSMAADGFSLGAIELNGANIQDAANNAMVTGTLNAKITEVSVAANNRMAFDSALSGSNTLTKTGAGELILRGTNSQTGDINITAGTLTINNEAQLGATTSKVLIADGACLKITSTLTLNTARAIEITGSGAIEVARGATVTYGGVLASANASSGLVKTGDGTLLLSGTNTYTGATDIRSGVLAVSGSLSDATAVSVARGGVYELRASDTVGSIEGAGDVQSGTASGTVTLTVGGAAGLGVTKTFSGVLADGSAVGKLALTKVGAGTLTLSNNNTYTGATAVNGGTLSLSTPTLATAGAWATATNGYATPSFAMRSFGGLRS
jgi:autotransporter-associated beta strand protein